MIDLISFRCEDFEDARLLEAEKKLTQLAKSLGAEEILQENRQLHREHAEMKRQALGAPQLTRKR